MSLPLLRSTALDIVYYHTQYRSRIKTGLTDRPILGSPLMALMVTVLDRRLFSAFSVESDILLPARMARSGNADAAWRVEHVYAAVPELRHRPAGPMSGGQGKMVALGGRK